ncbi:uncharacterized protein LOC135127429 [Zophobas morio]
MHRHITLVSKCLHIAAISVLVSAKIVPNYYTSSTKKSDENSQFNIGQIPQYTNLNTVQMGDLEKLVKQSLEHIFKNQELTNDGINNFGLKTSAIKDSGLDLSDDKSAEDLDLLLSPHILKVPVPQPYPVHIPVKQPFTVPIFKLVPDEVEKKIPIPVEKLVPVYKEKPVKIIVEKHHPVPVYKPYPVPVPVNTHVLVGNKKQQAKWY